MLSEENIDILEKEKGSVVCFMSCASIAHLKEGFENLIK